MVLVLSFPGTLTLSADRKTVTFSHSSPLSSSTSYIVTITTGVKDLAGNAMTVDKVWSFTTADTTPPTVTSTNPENGATDISCYFFYYGHIQRSNTGFYC